MYNVQVEQVLETYFVSVDSTYIRLQILAEIQAVWLSDSMVLILTDRIN